MLSLDTTMEIINFISPINEDKMGIKWWSNRPGLSERHSRSFSLPGLHELVTDMHVSTDLHLPPFSDGNQGK